VVPPDDQAEANGEGEEASLFERCKAKAETGKAKATALQRARLGLVEPVLGDARFNNGVDGFFRRGLGGARMEGALGLGGVNRVRMFGMAQGSAGQGLPGGRPRRRGSRLVSTTPPPHSLN
jgi:hypothetical protein